MDFLEDPRYRDLLERASSQGMVAELFLRHTRQSEVVVHQGKVESRRQSERLGMGLRVERGRRVGHASTTDLSAAGLEECLGEARELAELCEARPEASIPELENESSPLIDLGGEEILALDIEHRVAAARAAERAAFDLDPRIRKSESACWSDAVWTTRILNSYGLDRRERRAEAGLSVDLVAESEGEERTAYHHESRLKPSQLHPSEIGEMAARKALALLGSRVHATARAPVVLHHEVVADLLELLSESFSARACLLGTSILGGKRGERVAANCVELSDDPFHPQGTGGIAFDDEGIPAQRTALLEQGVLQSLLHNAHTARRMGETATANAARAGFAGSVGVGPSKLVLSPGTRTLDQVMSGIPRGFLVSSVMGTHMADIVSGDFSLGIVGRVIEDGELGEAIEGMTIAGNLLGLLESIEEIASDYDPHGDTGCASVLVGGLTVSGR